MTAAPVPTKTDHTPVSQVQLTPQWVLDLLGPIALDPCTEPDNPTGARTWLWAPQYDGRRSLWRLWADPGELIFVNPPFGDIPIWARKLATETKAAQCRGALLVPTGRSERMWFQIALRKATWLWLPHWRVDYSKAGRAKSASPFPSCMFLFGDWEARGEALKLGGRGTLVALRRGMIYPRGAHFKDEEIGK